MYRIDLLTRLKGDNMKKKIILILTILLLSGCAANANYDITIGKKISEKLTIEAYCDQDCNEREIERPYLKYYTNEGYDPYGPAYQEGFEYYNRTYSKDGDKVTLEYSGKFKLNEYGNSNIAKTFFSSIKSTYKNNILTINSGNNFYFKEGLDTLNVSITTNYKVIYNNADSQSGNTYTWTLKKDDPDTKIIYIEIDTNEEQESKQSNLILILIVGIILAIIGIAAIFMNIKNKKNNKI